MPVPQAAMERPLAGLAAGAAIHDVKEQKTLAIIRQEKLVMTTKDRRKLKRRINWARKQAAFGNIVQDCRGHPGKVITCSGGAGYGKGYIDMYDDSCEIKSLFDGSVSSCSLFNCVPQKLRSEEIDLLLAEHRNQSH
jgi:hypothetical protein